MWRTLHAEVMKLKHAPMLWISVIGVSVAPVLDAVLLCGARMQGREISWGNFTSQNLSFMTFLTGSMLFGLVATYVFGREYAEDTLKSLFVASIQRWWVVVSKLAVLFVWSMGLGAAAWAISAALGWLARFPGFSWAALLADLGHYAVACALIYCTLPVTAWIAMLCRGYIPPMAFALGASIAGFAVVFAGDKYASIFPWTIPTVYALAVRQGEAVLGQFLPSWMVLGAVFAVGTSLLLVQARYADVAG